MAYSRRFIPNGTLFAFGKVDDTSDDMTIDNAVLNKQIVIKGNSTGEQPVLLADVSGGTMIQMDFSLSAVGNCVLPSLKETFDGFYPTY